MYCMTGGMHCMIRCTINITIYGRVVTCNFFQQHHLVINTYIHENISNTPKCFYQIICFFLHLESCYNRNAWIDRFQNFMLNKTGYKECAHYIQPILQAKCCHDHYHNPPSPTNCWKMAAHTLDSVPILWV